MGCSPVFWVCKPSGLACLSSAMKAMLFHCAQACISKDIQRVTRIAHVGRFFIKESKTATCHTQPARILHLHYAAKDIMLLKDVLPRWYFMPNIICIFAGPTPLWIQILAAMKELLKTLAQRAQSKKRDFKLTASRIRKMKSARADQLFHELHTKAFEHIECLECANCCRGLGPRLFAGDIRKLAHHLKMKPATFTESYLRIDEDGDYVFKSMPCPFLQHDNYCLVYNARPKACREYPHTNQKNIKSILSTCVKNTETCPAVYEIFEKLPSFFKH